MLLPGSDRSWKPEVVKVQHVFHISQIQKYKYHVYKATIVLCYNTNIQLQKQKLLFLKIINCANNSESSGKCKCINVSHTIVVTISNEMSCVLLTIVTCHFTKINI